jgi:ATP-dependent Lon protease
LTVIPVETVEDVLKETLGISLPRIEHIFQQKVSGFLPFQE